MLLKGRLDTLERRIDRPSQEATSDREPECPPVLPKGTCRLSCETSSFIALPYTPPAPWVLPVPLAPDPLLAGQHCPASGGPAVSGEDHLLNLHIPALD